VAMDEGDSDDYDDDDDDVQNRLLY
jgi:hypothetical protein